MGGWTHNSLATSLPQPLLRWSSLWHSVIRPVVHHNVMLRNRVPLHALPALCMMDRLHLIRRMATSITDMCSAS